MARPRQFGGEIPRAVIHASHHAAAVGRNARLAVERQPERANLARVDANRMQPLAGQADGTLSWPVRVLSHTFSLSFGLSSRCRAIVPFVPPSPLSERISAAKSPAAAFIPAAARHSNINRNTGIRMPPMIIRTARTVKRKSRFGLVKPCQVPIRSAHYNADAAPITDGRSRPVFALIPATDQV